MLESQVSPSMDTEHPFSLPLILNRSKDPLNPVGPDYFISVAERLPSINGIGEDGMS